MSSLTIVPICSRLREGRTTGKSDVSKQLSQLPSQLPVNGTQV